MIDAKSIEQSIYLSKRIPRARPGMAIGEDSLGKWRNDLWTLQSTPLCSDVAIKAKYISNYLHRVGKYLPKLFNSHSLSNSMWRGVHEP